jgi:hypothetical protein
VRSAALVGIRAKLLSAVLKSPAAIRSFAAAGACACVLCPAFSAERDPVKTYILLQQLKVDR